MTRAKKLLLIGIPIIFLIAWVYPYLPGNEMTPCAIKHMLGVDCPGCKITRAVVAFVHGDFRSSLNLNPMGLIFILIISYLWIRTLFTELIFKREVGLLLSSTGRKMVATAFVLGLFIQWFAYLLIR